MWRLDARRTMYAAIHGEEQPLIPVEPELIENQLVAVTHVNVEYSHSSQAPERGWDMTGCEVAGKDALGFPVRLTGLHKVDVKRLPNWLLTLMGAAHPSLPLTVPTNEEPDPDDAEKGEFELRVKVNAETGSIGVILDDVEPSHVPLIFTEKFAAGVSAAIWATQDVRARHEGELQGREE